MIDLYPSRVADKPRISERQDPVIYSEHEPAKQGCLTDQQLAMYNKNGFLLLESVFSEPEINGMLQELDDIWLQNKASNQPEVIREPNSETIRSVFDIHRNNAFFNRVSRDPRLREAAELVLGGDVYIHQSRINFKPGFNGKDFYWHSDFETWHTEDGMPRMRAVSFSVLLDDNMPYNGSLMLIPGSHRYFVSCVGRTPDNHYQQSLRKQEVGVPDTNSLTWLAQQGGIQMPEARRGSVLMFECNTMHGSGSNISPYPRRNVFLVYNSVQNALVKPFCGATPRPDFVANRTPVVVEV